MLSNKPFLDKLFFHMYTIGYKNQGESLVFLIETDFGIVYSGVIDSYEYDEKNISIDILNRYGVTNVNFLCWTHPHEDHSIGYVRLVNQLANENTKIVYPENLLSLDEKYLQNESVKKGVSKIRNLSASSKKKKPKLRSVSDMKILEQMQFGTGQPDTKMNFLFQINSLAPISQIVEKRDLLGKVYSINDYSVVLNIAINEACFLLCGDIEDISIKNIEGYSIPPKIDYLKIPHHSSKGSLEILKWLENYGVDIACTTEYKKCNLPDSVALEAYKKYCEKIYSSHFEMQGYNHGILYTCYDVIKNSFYSTTEGRMKMI